MHEQENRLGCNTEYTHAREHTGQFHRHSSHKEHVLERQLATMQERLHSALDKDRTHFIDKQMTVKDIIDQERQFMRERYN